jgi:hypothetical protein
MEDQNGTPHMDGKGEEEKRKRIWGEALFGKSKRASSASAR